MGLQWSGCDLTKVATTDGTIIRMDMRQDLSKSLCECPGLGRMVRDLLLSL